MLGEVQVAVGPLAGVRADYRAEARLEADAENLTRGWVTKADVEGDEVAIEIRNSTVLTETLIGHLSIAGIDHNGLLGQCRAGWAWPLRCPACDRSGRPSRSRCR